VKEKSAQAAYVRNP